MRQLAEGSPHRRHGPAAGRTAPGGRRRQRLFRGIAPRFDPRGCPHRPGAPGRCRSGLGTSLWPGAGRGARSSGAGVSRDPHGGAGLPARSVRHGNASSAGSLGVRQVVDVTSPTGWSRLRQVVGQPATRAVARIQGPILEALAEAPADARLFVEALIRLAPDIPTVTTLAAAALGTAQHPHVPVCPGRAPSPKNYLAAIRLLHAAFLFETAGLSVADVSYRLEYSSPQSFGRHLRAMLGLTALEFRHRFPFPVALKRFIELMVEPYQEIWRGIPPGGRRQLGSGGRRRGPVLRRGYLRATARTAAALRGAVVRQGGHPKSVGAGHRPAARRR